VVAIVTDYHFRNLFDADAVSAASGAVAWLILKDVWRFFLAEAGSSYDNRMQKDNGFSVTSVLCDLFLPLQNCKDNGLCFVLCRVKGQCFSLLF